MSLARRASSGGDPEAKCPEFRRFDEQAEEGGDLARWSAFRGGYEDAKFRIPASLSAARTQGCSVARKGRSVRLLPGSEHLGPEGRWGRGGAGS